MKPFIVGQAVYYVDTQNMKVGKRIIKGIDKIDGIPRFWLQGYFGYFTKEMIYETDQQAVDALKYMKALRDRMSDERTKTLSENSG